MGKRSILVLLGVAWIACTGGTSDDAAEGAEVAPEAEVVGAVDCAATCQTGLRLEPSGCVTLDAHAPLPPECSPGTCAAGQTCYPAPKRCLVDGESREGTYRYTPGGCAWTRSGELPGRAVPGFTTPIVRELVASHRTPGTFYTRVHSSALDGSVGEVQLWVTGDAGSSWSEIGGSDSIGEVFEEQSGAYEALATFEGGTIARVLTSPAGAWLDLAAFPPDCRARELASGARAGGTGMWAALACDEPTGLRDRIVTSPDAGRTWSVTDTVERSGQPDVGPVRGIMAVEDGNVYFVRQGVGLFRSRDGGLEWERVLTPDSGVVVDLVGVGVASGADVFLTEAGVIKRSSDEGETFSNWYDGRAASYRPTWIVSSGVDAYPYALFDSIGGLVMYRPSSGAGEVLPLNDGLPPVDARCVNTALNVAQSPFEPGSLLVVGQVGLSCFID